MKHYLAILLLSTALITGCNTVEPYGRPDVSAPENWKGSQTKQDAIDATWWQQFNSTDLDQFITQAQQQNNDIKAALARIDQSRAQIKIAGSALLPSVNGNASIATNDGNRVSNTKNYSGGIAVAYELDLWGRNRNTREAATKNYNASLYDKDALSLVVTSETAQAYFNALGFQQRINNAERNLTLSKDVARIVNDRHDAGAASGQDVAQQNTAIANAEASLSTLRQQLSNTLSGLNVLLGQPPQTEIAAFKTKPDATPLDTLTVPTVAPLQPATLLERRPDIRSLEEGLKAANINIAIARANFFPTLSLGLNGTIGASPFSGPVALGTGLVGSVTAPIFNGGRLQGELELTNARQRELAESYKGAVLVAFRESEEALAAITAATEREKSLATGRDESRRYYDIARERYLSGADDFLTLLDAQRTLIQSEDTYTQAQLERLTASLALFKAMGGGWDSTGPTGN